MKEIFFNWIWRKMRKSGYTPNEMTELVIKLRTEQDFNYKLNLDKHAKAVLIQILKNQIKDFVNTPIFLQSECEFDIRDVYFNIRDVFFTNENFELHVKEELSKAILKMIMDNSKLEKVDDSKYSRKVTYRLKYTENEKRSNIHL